MGIPEPTGPLWSAVKAIHDSWPPDDEVAARAVGGAWRRGADVLDQSATEAGAAGEDVRAAWRDVAGDAFDGRLVSFRQTVGTTREQMLVLAAQGENYAGELEAVKTTITSTIAANEGTFARLADPRLGPLALPYRQAFATTIANYLQDMVAQRAAGLRAHPTQPGPPPPPPPRLTLPEPDSLDDLAADGLRGWGDIDQLFWRGVGDFGDDIYDGVGARGGDLIRGLGTLAGNADLVQQGDDFQLAADLEGDNVAERFLGIGADDQASLYHGATSIDGDKKPTTVYISRDRYPESAAHIDAAQAGTSYRGGEDTAYARQQPSELTVNRPGAKQNRADSLRGVPTGPNGQDRDEYPPAVFGEGGEGASVKYIDSSDNRGSGAKIGNQLRRYPVEDSTDRQTRRLDNGETVIIETY
jgi:hypothetical protein